MRYFKIITLTTMISLTISSSIYAQNKVGINIDTLQVELDVGGKIQADSAIINGILEINTTTGAFIPPRMSKDSGEFLDETYNLTITFLMKLNSSGNFTWAHTWPSGQEFGARLRISPSNKMMIGFDEEKYLVEYDGTE